MIGQAVGQGFSLTHRLFFAMGLAVLLKATMNALASVFLPIEMINGLVNVPTMVTMEEFRGHVGPVLGLSAFSMTAALYLLGGIVGSVGRLLRKEPLSFPGDFFKAANRWFFSLVGWAFGLGLIAIGLAILVGIVVGFLLAALRRDQVLQNVVRLSVMATLLISWTALIFSPAIFVESGCGVWRSLSESFRFTRKHLGGVFGLIWVVLLVGMGCLLVTHVLESVVQGLRQVIGIPTSAKGWPVFFFGLILKLPQSYLTVFFPALLYAYYHAATSTESPEKIS